MPKTCVTFLISKILRRQCIIVILVVCCCSFIIHLRFCNYEPGRDTDTHIQDPEPNIKYILLWNAIDYSPFYNFGVGRSAFVHNNCTYTNCFVTSNRKQNLEKFHAIAFNGRCLGGMTQKDIPQVRYPHQKYIYFNSETDPECNTLFEKFFNWTATYRLNSDIVSPYFRVKDWKGAIVGPKANIEWKNNMKDVDDELAGKLLKKTKAVAWFASHCKTPNNRIEVVKLLQWELSHYGLLLDVYGKCGNLHCERGEACDNMISSDYYFYLAFENSMDEDYVTEKLTRALQHDTVPIVFGGADYSRFLPPGSYLQARRKHINALAKRIAHLISNPDDYKEYFRWRSYYTYDDALATYNVCDLCSALNNQSMMSKHTVYRDFRRWWNPHYRERCKH